MSSERVIVEAIKVAQVVLCQNVPPAQRRPSRCARSSAYFPITHRLERVALSDSSGAILLYRALINPDIPGMAFNGYNGIGVCQLAVEVGATWLLQYIEGRVKLPRRTAMMERFARNSSCANACYRPRSARQFTPLDPADYRDLIARTTAAG
jgi:hypothetical protein